MSRRDRSWLSFIVISVVTVIAILGLFFPRTKSFSGVVDDFVIALEDNTTQYLTASNTWTSITYNGQIHVSSAWAHTAGSNQIRCLREGTYSLYFSIQPQLNSTQVQTLYHCKPCHLFQQLRATIQYDGIGFIYEIRSSLTRSDREARFLSKSILFHAHPDDIIRIQFNSLCPNVVISSGASPMMNSYPTSATLTITD